MKTTLNQALEMAAKGCWSAAYEIAMKDEGIDKETSFFAWKNFAEKAIARRNAKAQMPEAYYS